VKRTSVLDSFALLAYLKKEVGYRKVKDILSSHEKGDEGVMINEVNVGEVYYILARERSSAAAEQFIQDILPALPVALASNSFSDVIAAAKMKAQFRIAYADAFAVATAAKHSAVLITGDPDFKQVEHLVEVDWLV